MTDVILWLSLGYIGGYLLNYDSKRRLNHKFKRSFEYVGLPWVDKDRYFLIAFCTLTGPIGLILGVSHLIMGEMERL